MTIRLPAEAALAIVAPKGLASVQKATVALDVRCRCQAVLLRLVRTQEGLLAIRHQHNPPTQAQLRAKGEEWSGVQRQDAQVVETDHGVKIASVLSTQVGWWMEPSWFDLEDSDAGLWSGAVRCRCGYVLIMELLRSSVLSQLATKRSRVLAAPRAALLDRAAHLDWVRKRHQRVLADEVARRQEHKRHAET